MTTTANISMLSSSSGVCFEHEIKDIGTLRVTTRIVKPPATSANAPITYAKTEDISSTESELTQQFPELPTWTEAFNACPPTRGTRQYSQNQQVQPNLWTASSGNVPETTSSNTAPSSRLPIELSPSAEAMNPVMYSPTSRKSTNWPTGEMLGSQDLNENLEPVPAPWSLWGPRAPGKQSGRGA